MIDYLKFVSKCIGAAVALFLYYFIALAVMLNLRDLTGGDAASLLFLLVYTAFLVGSGIHVLEKKGYI